MYIIKGSGVSFRLTENEAQQLNSVAELLQQDEKNITSAKVLILTLSHRYSVLIRENDHLRATLNDNLDSTKDKQQALLKEIEEYKTTNDQQQTRIQELTQEIQTLQQQLISIQQEPEPQQEEEPQQQNYDIDAMLAEEKGQQNKDVIERYADIIKLIGYQEDMIPSEEKILKDVVDILSEPMEPEIVEKIVEIEKKLQDNEFIIQLEPAQKRVLEVITRWRFQTKKDVKLLSIPQVIKRMVFNRGTLLNWHEEFETGIKEKHIKG